MFNRIRNGIRNWFGKVNEARKGLICAEELRRSLVTAFGSGSFSGVALVVLNMLISNVHTIFPNQLIGSLMLALFTLAADLIRRLFHDTTPPLSSTVEHPA